MLRITDLDSGKSVDLAVEEVLVECFRQQVDRGRSPKSLKAFRQRLESTIVAVITDAIDLGLQPPLSCELTEAGMLAMTLGIPIPKKALRRRSHLLRFILDHKHSPHPSSEGTTDS